MVSILPRHEACKLLVFCVIVVMREMVHGVRVAVFALLLVDNLEVVEVEFVIPMNATTRSVDLGVNFIGVK